MGLGLLGAAALAVAWLVLRHIDWLALLEHLKTRPLLFFTAMAVLPAAGAPMAAFYLAAGAAFPFALALVGTLVAMTINLALSYAAARWLIHPPIEKLARRMGYTVPAVRHEDRWVVTLLLRITPGPPFFMQHYLLALGRVPFPTYMIVSVPVCGLLAAAFVGAGAGLTSGSVVNLILGLFVLIAIILGVRLGRKYLQRRARVKVGPQGEIAPRQETDVEPAGGA